MKEKIVKMKPFILKALIIISVAVLYTFLFDDFFKVYDSGPYIISATFLTYMFVLKEKFNEKK